MIEPREELSKLSDYVPGKSIEEIRERYGLTDVIKLASNENPLGASPKAIEAFHKIAGELHLYPRGDAPKLIDAIAQKFDLPKNQIIIGNGSDEIIDMIGKAFIRGGDNCIALTPTFSVYKFTTLSNGGDFIAVGNSAEKTPLKNLIEKINEKTRVIFVCSPNNPTGHFYTEKELAEFLEKVPKNILVFLDEAYAEFATSNDFPQMKNLLARFENLFVNRTFSKIYGLAGLRVGYGFASAEIIRHLWKVKPPFDVNQAAQVAAIAALDDDSHINNTRTMNADGLTDLQNTFENFGFKVLPTEANFICVHIGEKSLEYVSFLEAHGMIIRYLKSFGLPEHVRITIGKKEENACLIALTKKWLEVQDGK